jgi:uncharacterized membrane protein
MSKTFLTSCVICVIVCAWLCHITNRLNRTVANDEGAITSSPTSGTAAVADALTDASEVATPVTASVTSAVITQHNTAPRWNVESLNEGVSASTLAQIREFARIQANRDVELTRLRNEVCY